MSCSAKTFFRKLVIDSQATVTEIRDLKQLRLDDEGVGGEN